MNDAVAIGVYFGATYFALGKIYESIRWVIKRKRWADSNRLYCSNPKPTIFNPMGMDGYSWKHWYLS
mgnify:CR=1 FL=1